MVPLSQLATFAVAAFVSIVIPGPNVLFAIGRALVLGRRPAVLGTTAGSVVPLPAVALGLGALLTASAVAFVIVKVVGAVAHGSRGRRGGSRRSAARAG
ncbi:hypothetical protein [Nocardia sp. BMG111209]|uniref:hypothetical protein n=1 Tax=Nocardia sp. BMG111209 TaxID=1160137 RepID=UPI00035D819B